MNTPASVPVFREINDCHEATGSPLRTDLPAFHVFSIGGSNPCRLEMPPFRRGFYQLTFMETLGKETQLRVEDAAVAGTQNALVASPPEQIMSWTCGGSDRGFILCFKAELLDLRGQSLEQAFPFFDVFAVNVVPLTATDRASLRIQFERMEAVFKSGHPYRLPQLAALTQALLYDCLALFDRHAVVTIGNRESSAGVVTRFRQMVARCFQQHCSVEDYARCLNLSADHLRVLVKKHTGRTARSFIDERVLIEARRLLNQTELSVSEIGHHLRFSEPTHFTRFFKRQTGMTPGQFRRQVQQTAAPAVEKQGTLEPIGA